MKLELCARTIVLKVSFIFANSVDIFDMSCSTFDELEAKAVLSESISARNAANWGERTFMSMCGWASSREARLCMWAAKPMSLLRNSGGGAARGGG